LYGGLEQGFSILVKEPNTARKRIFLFSDGLVNAGKTNESDIFEGVRMMHKSDINFTTFGIGSDFDEKIMRGVAEHGSGDYFFIKQAEDIVTQVGKGLKVLVRHSRVVPRCK
jgi:Ca-activated chloride channel family protein